MNEAGQPRRGSRRVSISTAASVALLGVTVIPAFSSGNFASMALWVVAIPLYAVAVVDLHFRSTPARIDEARGMLWRDALVTAALGGSAGIAAAAIWAWVAGRVDHCPPSAPFGGCGGERFLVGIASPLSLGIIATALVLLRVSRGALIGAAAVPVAAGIVALYNARQPGTPVPSHWLMAGLISAGFLLAWGSTARVIPPLSRFGLITVLLSMPLLKTYLDR